MVSSTPDNAKDSCKISVTSLLSTGQEPPACTRFAPSPTGDLHLGHARGALIAAASAGPGGRFLVRIEDIDATRCKPLYTAAILEDLAWLGLRWEEPVRRQSEHFEEYQAALNRLDEAGLIYRCTCTRAEIAASASAPHGPEGALYPGTCRGRKIVKDGPYALRLDMAEAMRRTGPLMWHDRERGDQQATPGIFGDVVLARKETPTSYHLAVTVDDALQGVTLVTRGDDLFTATHVHRLLQALLGLPVPEYHHHALVKGPDGQRLAKRNHAATLRSLREAGMTPAEVRALALNGQSG